MVVLPESGDRKFTRTGRILKADAEFFFLEGSGHPPPKGKLPSLRAITYLPDKKAV